MKLAIDLGIISVFGIIWLSIVTFIRVKKNKSWMYIGLFTLFFVYLFKVLDYTLFQYQSLLLLKHFMPQLMINGYEVEKSINLIPLVNLTAGDIKTSLLNILLMVPFGFGLPFITNFSMKRIVVIGALFSILIELLQLSTGLLAGVTFRIADSNDVLFNTLGVIIGYILFTGVKSMLGLRLPNQMLR